MVNAFFSVDTKQMIKLVISLASVCWISQMPWKISWRYHKSSLARLKGVFFFFFFLTDGIICVHNFVFMPGVTKKTCLSLTPTATGFLGQSSTEKKSENVVCNLVHWPGLKALDTFGNYRRQVFPLWTIKQIGLNSAINNTFDALMCVRSSVDFTKLFLT